MARRKAADVASLAPFENEELVSIRLCALTKALKNRVQGEAQGTSGIGKFADQ
jgi:hypothetical protein